MTEKRKKVIALVGPSGSGKDTLLKESVKALPLKKITTCTTRPKRENEKDGVDYHFLSGKAFITKIANFEMLEVSSFKTNEGYWYYGTDIKELDDNMVNIGVFNMKSLSYLIQDGLVDIYPLYIKANDKDRLFRQLSRETEPNCLEICRRFISDNQDFNNFEYKDKLLFYNNCEIQDIKNFPKILKNTALKSNDGWI